MATRNTDERLVQFLQINGMTCEEAATKGKEALNLKDSIKLQVAGFLLDRWCIATSLDGKEYFVKHLKSEKTNVLYQIILGGEDWDGVYTMVFKRCPVGVDFCTPEELTISSFGNYDAALFKDSDTELQPILISESKENKFVEELLNKNFMTQEEIEIYRKPDAIIRPYLRKVLPRIKFMC